MTQATTMCELMPIAIDILNKISYDGTTPIAQVCGPISTGGFGCIEKNLEVFEMGINILEERGHVVFNQLVFQKDIIRITKHDPANSGYKTEILTDFFKPIFESGLIKIGCFIPNFGTSEGSIWEYNFLKELGVERRIMEKVWFDGINFAL